MRLDYARLKLERRKVSAEAWARRRELTLRREESVLRAREMVLKEREHARARWLNPAVLALLAAAVGLLSNAVVAFLNSYLGRSAEAEKAEYARVLEMIKVGSRDQASENLRMLLDAGLYTDSSGKLAGYLAKLAPGEGVVLPPPSIRSAGPVRRPIDPAEITKASQEASPEARRWLDIAIEEIGIVEEADGSSARIAEYLEAAGWTGDARGVPWSAAFLAWVMKQAGYAAPPGPARGLSWANWGEPLAELKPGAVVIASRGRGMSLVGLALGQAGPDTVRVLAGNVFDQVTVTSVPRRIITDIRWPKP